MKILTIHASAGAGHLKAAEAIYKSIQKYTAHEVVFVDALDYTYPLFKKFYRDTYVFLISKFPFVWKWGFMLLDIPKIQGLVRFFRRGYNRFNGGKLHHFLKEEQFDYIFSTQFLSTEVAAAMKRSGEISGKLITVVTDFDVHRIWTAEEVDMYAVASDWTKKKLKRIGISEKKIIVTGIPTDEKFFHPGDIKVLKQSLELQENIFTVLIATGSFGIGPIEEILNRLEGFQVMVVCGHNKNLFQRLSSQQSELIKIFGLVDNMPELMAVADMMVTKPGGLSISEALVSQLPMIFFNAIPGQEENNIKVLKEYGIGISDCSVDEIAMELKKMRDTKDIFLTAVKRTQKLARPSAAKDIVALIR
ncbi:hypothetical protein MNBD_UNCLBAC01-346 [hydrothermal vent metagenome]|uniref:Monogalactosyldiacylglycerol synthase n=1 Tax=hydrothermal vent metagenome TaxID=652676 RepID=A0A3B1DSC7_9ZZZZ